jgi:hypothetical protein
MMRTLLDRVLYLSEEKNNRQYIVRRSLAVVPNCSQYRLGRKKALWVAGNFFKRTGSGGAVVEGSGQ